MADYSGLVRCVTGCVGRYPLHRVPVLELWNDTVKHICNARNRDFKIAVPAARGVEVITSAGYFFSSNCHVDPRVEPGIDCRSAAIRALGILDPLSSRSLC